MRRRPRSRSRHCFVYFLKRESDGLIKIGRTSNPRHRLQTLNREYGERLVMLTYCEAGLQAEYNLHNAFQLHRVEGEWFRPHQRLEVVIDMVAATDTIPWDLVLAAPQEIDR